MCTIFKLLIIVVILIYSTFFRVVKYNNQKAFMVDLKPVYRAPTKEAAELALDELEAKWGSALPTELSDLSFCCTLCCTKEIMILCSPLE